MTKKAKFTPKKVTKKVSKTPLELLQERVDHLDNAVDDLQERVHNLELTSSGDAEQQEDPEELPESPDPGDVEPEKT
jgi:hypothetical protein